MYLASFLIIPLSNTFAMKKMLVFGVLIIAGGGISSAQTELAGGKAGGKNYYQNPPVVSHMEIQNGDTVFNYGMRTVDIISLRTFTDKSDQRKYNRLVKAVKKVYPYARQAGERLQASNKAMTHMSRPERKAHMKKVEKQLEKEFGKEIKNLNFTEGRILLKLIDRETGRTAYRLVDDLRGRFTAWFYDGLAGMFGYDLERKYQPEKVQEDKYIEEIVQLIELGKI